jgi:hypothetical protein
VTTARLTALSIRLNAPPPKPPKQGKGRKAEVDVVDDEGEAAGDPKFVGGEVGVGVGVGEGCSGTCVLEKPQRSKGAAGREAEAVVGQGG